MCIAKQIPTYSEQFLMHSVFIHDRQLLKSPLQSHKKSKFCSHPSNTVATKVRWLSGLIIRTIPFTIGPAPEQA